MTEVERPADRFFSAEEYAQRTSAVRKNMAERELDALLLVSPENIYYLVGLSHQGYFAFTLLLFPFEGVPRVVTRSMERVTLMQQAPDVEHVGFDDHVEPGEAVAGALRDAGFSHARVGVERNTMFFPLRAWDQVRTELPDVTWEDALDTVDEVRQVKSELEIYCIRQAAALSDRAVRSGIKAAGVGVNEREVASEVYRSMVLGGSEYPGFAPLVRSTDLIAQEHATWRDRTLAPGDALLLELSSSVRRYHAPLTRVVHVGRASHGVKAAGEIALEGLETIRAALRPGMLTGDVYAAWQEVVDDALGPGRYERHHCGYTVGIGFPPSWVGGSTVVGIRPGGRIEVREGMVFHVLSWLIGVGPADFGVSDTVLVTADGGELLTSTSREPILIS
ncbi:MAG: M24 family metallopeptidase [Actinomycetota bacterium]